MLKIFDEDYGQLELWMDFYPHDPFDLSPELRQIAEILDLPEILEPFISVYEEAIKENKLELTGRNTIPLRTFLGIMYLYSSQKLSYRALMEQIDERLSWRVFCRIPFSKKVPDYSTVCKLANRFGAKPLEQLNKALLQHLEAQKILKARRIRMDTTVVESNIEYPTDAGLLAKGIRKVNRLVQNLEEAGVKVARNFVYHGRAVKKRLLEISKVTVKRTGEAIQAVNQITSELVKVAQDTLKRAGSVVRGAKVALAKGNQRVKGRIIDELQKTREILKQVIEQAQMVIAGNRHIPNRLVSIYDLKARPIKKGKRGKPVEFGRKVSVHTNEQGLVTGWRVYEGNPSDNTTVIESIEQFTETTGQKPREGAYDRGGYSRSVEEACLEKGVRLAIPKVGKKDATRRDYERKAWFKKMQRWRAGIEGKISVLKRRYRWNRATSRKDGNTERTVAWGAIAHNLDLIPRLA